MSMTITDNRITFYFSYHYILRKTKLRKSRQIQSEDAIFLRCLSYAPPLLLLYLIWPLKIKQLSTSGIDDENTFSELL